MKLARLYKYTEVFNRFQDSSIVEPVAYPSTTTTDGKKKSFAGKLRQQITNNQISCSVLALTEEMNKTFFIGGRPTTSIKVKKTIIQK